MSSQVSWLFCPLAALLLFVAVERARSLAPWPRRLVTALLGTGASWLAVPALRMVLSNLASPREWDFVCFWLWGRLAVLGVDFYDPAQGIALGRELRVSDELTRDILHVGFWYPPPTMLLFAPLGLLSMKTALAVWYAVQALFAVGAVALLVRTFLKQEGALGWVTAAGLFMLCPSTRSTVWFAQSNFMLLVLFLLAVRDREKARAGIWLALGTIVKPYFAFFLAYLLVRRAYRPLLAAVATLSLAVVLSGALFGLTPLMSFLRESPASRVPGYIYGEPMNQSLLGMVLRTQTGALEGPLASQPLYLAGAVAIVLVTVAVWRSEDENLGSRETMSTHGLLLTLLVALLLYPGTLAHYSVLLLAPIVCLWGERYAVRGGPVAVIGVLVAALAMLGWDRFESYNFWANVTMWGASVAGWVRGERWIKTLRRLLVSTWAGVFIACSPNHSTEAPSRWNGDADTLDAFTFGGTALGSHSSPGTIPEPNVQVDIPKGAMTLGSLAFGANPLVISPGTTVVWTNRDSELHTATSDTAIWDSGLLATGASFYRTFVDRGTFPYHCVVHGAASMWGTIVVRESPAGDH